MLRRRQLVLVAECDGCTASFRGAELVELLAGRTLRIESDSLPKAFLEKVASEGARSTLSSDGAIAFRIPPELQTAVHTIPAAELDGLRRWLSSASGT